MHRGVASEETPLLSSSGELDIRGKVHDAVYDLVTPRQKRTIVGLVSLAGISPCMFLPAYELLDTLTDLAPLQSSWESRSSQPYPKLLTT